MTSARWPLAALTLAIVVALTTTAAAQKRRPRLSIVDRGEQVEIVVHDVRLADPPAMKLKGDRIELPLAGLPNAVNDVYPVGLVARVDVRGERERSMSVKLRRTPAMTAALARGALARQEDDGVHLFVPKAAPAPGAVAVAPPAPAPVAEKAPGAAAGTTVGIAGATPAPVVEKQGDATPAPAAVDSATTAPAAPSAEDAAAPLVDLSLTGTGTGTGTDTAQASAPLTGGGSGPGFGRVVIAIGAIGLVGLAVVLFRRRRGAAATTPTQQLEVLAARSLGGKTRIVWLGVGDRELVVAVGAQQTNLLGQWRRGEVDRAPAATLPRAETRGDARDARDDEPGFAAGSTQVQVSRTRSSSSAVSGLMRLRGRSAAAYAGDASPADESDEQWARDILAAAGGRR